MWQPVRNVWQFMRRRPWFVALGVFGVVLLVLASVFFNINSLARSHYQKAQKALKEEKYQEAHDALQQCLKVRWWQSAETYFLAARLERLLGNYSEANTFLKKSLVLRGQMTETIQTEGILLAVESGGLIPETEKKLWERVEKKHPDSVQVLRSLAKVYTLQFRFLPALGTLAKWLNEKPNSGEALEWRAQILKWLQKNANAEEDLRQALKVAPHRNEARLALVQLLLETNGDPKEIMEHVQHLLKKDPARSDYLVVLAQCQTLQGEFSAARQVLNQVFQADPKNAYALLTRTELEYQAGQFAAAEEWAWKVAKRNPNELRAYHLLAESLKRQGDPEKKKEAEFFEEKYLAWKADHKRLGELLKESLEIEKGNPDFFAEIGEILLRTGQEQNGLVWLNEALVLDPHHKTAHTALAGYYNKKGEPHRAAKHLKQAKLSSPQ